MSSLLSVLTSDKYYYYNVSNNMAREQEQTIIDVRSPMILNTQQLTLLENYIGKRSYKHNDYYLKDDKEDYCGELWYWGCMVLSSETREEACKVLMEDYELSPTQAEQVVNFTLTFPDTVIRSIREHDPDYMPEYTPVGNVEPKRLLAFRSMNF